jgi:hypothetical protein
VANLTGQDPQCQIGSPAALASIEETPKDNEDDSPISIKIPPFKLPSFKASMPPGSGSSVDVKTCWFHSPNLPKQRADAAGTQVVEVFERFEYDTKRRKYQRRDFCYFEYSEGAESPILHDNLRSRDDLLEPSWKWSSNWYVIPHSVHCDAEGFTSGLNWKALQSALFTNESNKRTPRGSVNLLGPKSNLLGMCKWRKCVRQYIVNLDEEEVNLRGAAKARYKQGEITKAEYDKAVSTAVRAKARSDKKREAARAPAHNLHASFSLRKTERDFLELQVVPLAEVRVMSQLKSSIQVLEEYRLFLRRCNDIAGQLKKVFTETDFQDVLEVLKTLSAVLEEKKEDPACPTPVPLSDIRHMVRELKVLDALFLALRAPYEAGFPKDYAKSNLEFAIIRHIHREVAHVIARCLDSCVENQEYIVSHTFGQWRQDILPLTDAKITRLRLSEARQVVKQGTVDDRTYFIEAVDQLGFGVAASLIIHRILQNSPDLLDETSIEYIVDKIIGLIKDRGPIPQIFDLLTALCHQEQALESTTRLRRILIGGDRSLWIPFRLFQGIFSGPLVFAKDEKSRMYNRLHILMETSMGPEGQAPAVEGGKGDALVSWFYGKKWHRDMECLFYPPQLLDLKAVSGDFSPSFRQYRDALQAALRQKLEYRVKVSFEDKTRQEHFKYLLKALTLEVQVSVRSMDESQDHTLVITVGQQTRDVTLQSRALVHTVSFNIVSRESEQISIVVKTKKLQQLRLQNVESGVILKPVADVTMDAWTPSYAIVHSEHIQQLVEVRSDASATDVSSWGTVGARLKFCLRQNDFISPQLSSNGVRKAASPYIDEPSLSIEKIPVGLGAAHMIPTYNSDIHCDATKTYIRVEVNQPSTLFVFTDVQIPPPHWLSMTLHPDEIMHFLGGGLRVHSCWIELPSQECELASSSEGRKRFRVHSTQVSSKRSNRLQAAVAVAHSTRTTTTDMQTIVIELPGNGNTNPLCNNYFAMVLPRHVQGRTSPLHNSIGRSKGHPFFQGGMKYVTHVDGHVHSSGWVRLEDLMADLDLRARSKYGVEQRRMGTDKRYKLAKYYLSMLRLFNALSSSGLPHIIKPLSAQFSSPLLLSILSNSNINISVRGVVLSLLRNLYLQVTFF